MRRERRPKQAKPSQSCGSGRKALFFLTVVGGGRKRGGFSRSIGRFLTICLSFLSLGDVDDQFRPSSFSLSLSLVGKEEKNCQSRLDEPSSSFFFFLLSLSLSCVHYVVLTSRYPSVCLVVALSLSLFFKKYSATTFFLCRPFSPNGKTSRLGTGCAVLCGSQDRLLA